MPPPYLVTPTAANDIDVIWKYIASDNLEAANRVDEAIYAAFVLLGANSMLGSVRKDATSAPVRFWPVTQFPNFIVVYVPEPKPIQVVAVVHGKRDLRSFMRLR